MPIDFRAAQQLIQAQSDALLAPHSSSGGVANQHPHEAEEARCRSSRLQSSQLTSLSWQYALLLPRCVRPISSPISSIGVPIEISSGR